MLAGGKHIWTIVLLIVAAAAIPGYYALKESSPSKSNVLWITMDSLRYDHLGCCGHRRMPSPNIDALAKHGALFTQSVSQASYTQISVPSMITGKYPFFLGLRTLYGALDTSHVTLAEALAEEGYFTYAIAEPWPRGFFQGMERFVTSDRRTSLKTQRCLDVLDQLDERPFFIWLYYWDPHAPYAPPEQYITAQRIGDGPGMGEIDPGPEDNDSTGVSTDFEGTILLLLQLNRGKTTLTEAERDYLIELYDAEIALVDSQIKKVVAKLQRMDLWDRTIVVLNADHGEAFGEHGCYYHGNSLYEEEVRVPLIIKPPRSMASGKIIDGAVRNLDIVPTILDYCGVTPPQGLNGQSLRPFLEKDLSPHLPACMEIHRAQTGDHLMAYRDGRHKLIYNLSHGRAELYDLATDPGERENLLAREDQGSAADLETQLRNRLTHVLNVKALSALELKDDDVNAIDPETRAQLKALGYIY